MTKQQEEQFSVWGISREWRRNFIGASFAILCATVVAVWTSGEKRESRLIQENLTLQKHLLECEQKSAVTINQLRVEQIAFMNSLLEQKKEVEKELHKLSKRVRR